MTSTEPEALLASIRGRGYAVIESLPALGKGKRCDGLFRCDPAHAVRLEEALEQGAPLEFEGPVHHRHLSFRSRFPVSVSLVRLDPRSPDELLVEFVALTEPEEPVVTEP